MADELNDVPGQVRALNNLGHHFLSSGSPEQAIPYLDRCLQLSVKLKDRMCEFRACNHLGQVSVRLVAFHGESITESPFSWFDL